MKIRFLQSIADASGWYFDYGEVADVPDERALAFIKTGHAEAVRDGADETATLTGSRLRKG